MLFRSQGDPVPLPDLSELEAAAKQARDKYYSYGSVQKQRDPEGFQAAKQNFEDLSNQLSTMRQAQIAQIQKDYPTREAQVAALKSQGAPAPSPAPSAQDLSQLGVGLLQPSSTPTAPRRPAPAPAAAPRPAAPTAAPGGGLPSVADVIKESQGVLGASPDIAAARSKAQELSELLKNTPLPGIEAIAALRKGA